MTNALEFEAPNLKSDLPFRSIDIWTEGYAANEGRFGCFILDTVQARTFDEAVELYAKANPQNAHLIRKDEVGQWRFWGCKLYDNQAEASVSFG